MREQDVLVSNGYDVVVERARRDRLLCLRDQQYPVWIETMIARDGGAGLDMLPCRKGAAASPEDEHFDARLAMRTSEPHVVRRAFVAEGGGHGLVDAEVAAVGEG